jgi:hypothetical protein
MGTILTTASEYEQIRKYLGLNAVTFPDSAVSSAIFLDFAEMVISKAVNDMATSTAGFSPTVTQIMNEVATVPTPIVPATLTDRSALKNAVKYYIGWMFTPAEPNSVNTSVTLGKQTVDLGGIGAQWIEQGQRALDLCIFALTFITGWVTVTPVNIIVNGNTRAGYDANTISGIYDYLGSLERYSAPLGY